MSEFECRRLRAAILEICDVTVLYGVETCYSLFFSHFQGHTEIVAIMLRTSTLFIQHLQKYPSPLQEIKHWNNSKKNVRTMERYMWVVDVIFRLDQTFSPACEETQKL